MNSSDDASSELQPGQQKPIISFKGLKPLAIIATVLLVALVAGTGGYFLGTRNNQSVPSSQLKQSDDVVTQPSPMAMQISPSPFIPASPGSLISTANWQTYTNTKYRYFLRYPREWFIYDRDLYGEEKPISELDKEDYIFITPVKPSIGGGRDPGVIIQADENTTRLTSMEYVQKYMLSKYEMEKTSCVLNRQIYKIF